MTDVIARINIKGKHYEIIVDAESALNFKKTGQGDISQITVTDKIYHDTKKGELASQSDLEDAFETTDVIEVSKKIISRGDVQVPQEIREKDRGEKFKQVVNFLVKNATNPQSDMPYTPERIERALDESGVNIQNKPIENQIKEIVSSLSKVIPIKIETKKILLTIPAQYTGQAYGIVNIYKESEEWLSNGDLKVTLNVPVGYQMEFYDKINSITHGSVISEEIKENE